MCPFSSVSMIRNMSWILGPFDVAKDASVAMDTLTVESDRCTKFHPSFRVSVKNFVALVKDLRSCGGDGWFPDSINCFGAHKSGLNTVLA